MGRFRLFFSQFNANSQNFILLDFHELMFLVGAFEESNPLLHWVVF